MVNDDRSRALEAAFCGKPKLDKAAAKTKGWRIELDRAACDIRSVDNQCNEARLCRVQEEEEGAGEMWILSVDMFLPNRPV
jgi:hypothetical protein